MVDQASVLNNAVQKATVTRGVFVAPSALTALPEAVRVIVGKPFVIVGDNNTMTVAGRDAVTILKQAGLPVSEPIVLGEKPRVKPHARTAREVAAAIRDHGAIPISVGSGVINDLTKYAAE